MSLPRQFFLSVGLFMVIGMAYQGYASAQGSGLHPPSSVASQAARRTQGRNRVALIRESPTAHQQLRQGTIPLSMPRSTILSDQAAAGKRYSDSWTCRESTKALIGQLAQKGIVLQLSSSGPNTFPWGQEGKVSYHYYGVDNPQHPTVLIDPTAGSNFKGDARVGGGLRTLLLEVGKKRGQLDAAQRVAERIEKSTDHGLLVLTKTKEIALYQAALKRAAELARRRSK